MKDTRRGHSKRELLSKMKRGAANWNRWRVDNFVSLDLRNGDFRGFDLSGFDLSQCLFGDANFDRVKLVESDLRGSNLGYASLHSADLSGAILRDSILGLSNFTRANLTEADLTRSSSQGVDFSDAVLTESTLEQVDFTRAKFVRASLRGTRAWGAGLVRADLREADLRDADLVRADLYGADLRKADLRGANLERAALIESDLRFSNLTGCRIYGAGVWGVRLTKAVQNNLIIAPITDKGHGRGTGNCRRRVSLEVDNLQVAQFIYLLLDNKNIRDVIDTVGKKLVLILGRFTTTRKLVLESIRSRLRQLGFVPVLFDFAGPQNRDTTETVSTLAHLARFIVADITNARSIPQELMRIVPALPSVPVQPIAFGSGPLYSMFGHFRRFPWVLTPLRYVSIADLMRQFEDSIVRPAEKAADAGILRR